MKTILHQQRRSSMAAAAVTTVLGLVLVIWPGQSARLLCLLLGAAVFITGVIYLLGWVARRGENRPAVLLLPGVVLCAVGLWLMTRPESVVLLVQLVVGAILIFHGAVDIQGAVALMRMGMARWWLDLALSALTVALGALVIVNPFGTFAALTMLIGFALIYDGLSDFYIIWRLSRAFRQAEQELDDDGSDW